MGNPYPRITRTIQEVMDELYKNSIHDYEKDCWLWQGHTNKKDGYGRIRFQGKQQVIHRLSFTYFVHEPTKLVCHTCDVRRCWNPDHLFEGTHEDNARDMAAKGRQWMQKNVSF